MVNLKSSRRELPPTKSATLSVSSNESLLKAFWESAASALASSRILRIAKAIGTNASATWTINPKSLERDPVLSHIARSTGRVVVPIVVRQLRRRDVAVFQNVVENATRPECGYAIYLALKIWVDLHRGKILRESRDLPAQYSNIRSLNSALGISSSLALLAVGADLSKTGPLPRHRR